VDKIGAAVIGLRMGMNHLEAYLSNPHCQVVAVCDKNEDLLKQVAAKHNIPLAVPDAEKVFGDSRIKVLTVAVPDHFHAAYTVKALQAGHHVLCEKPMAPTVKECQDMVAASERTGRKLMIGQSYRYNPAYLVVKQAVDRGEVGKLYFVESEYWNNLTAAQGVGGWRNDPKIRHPFVGGSHALDLMRWVAGDVAEVFAIANHLAYLAQPTDDCIMANVRFESGCIGRALVSSGCARPFLTTLRAYGVEGSLDGDTLWKSRTDKQPQKLPLPQVPPGVRGETADFVKAVLEDAPVPIDARDGAKSTIACLAVVQASLTGKRFRMDNKNLTYFPI
jgi:predicted dehydrogenase